MSKGEIIYRDAKNINFKYAVGKVDIYGRLFHDFYEIYLLFGGDVEFISDNTRCALKPYTLVIIPPGEYHQYVTTGDMASYDRCVMCVYPEFLESDLLSAALFGKGLFTLQADHRIVEHFRYLKQCAHTLDDEDFAHVLTGVGTDIIFLIKNHAESELLPGSLRPISLALMKLINERYKEEIDLAMLSRHFHFSVSQLSHIFKEDYGISIKKYILQKRMNGARLSLQSGKGAEEVCAEYGFANYSTFYRAYVKYFGVAPSKTAHSG